MEVPELDLDTAPAIKTLGSLFTLTQVFLRDDSYAETRDSLPGSLHDEDTTDDLELSRQLSALGLPISFRTSKVTKNGMVKGKGKKKSINQKHCYCHEGNDVETEEVGSLSVEEVDSENLTSSITCDTIEEPECQGFSRATSDYSLNSDAAPHSASSEVLDHDEIDSKVIGDLEKWTAYWDSFYSRYFFYNTITNESTWDPPLGMEHPTVGEVIDKANDTIGDISENLDSLCSIDSFGEFKKDDQSLDQIPSEPCLRSELAGDNFDSSMSLSTLNYSSENLNEEQELKQSCFEESLINLNEQEPCLRFELAGENFDSSMSLSTLNYSSENLNEEQELKQSCFEESSINLLQDDIDSVETKLEERGISKIIQSPTNCTIHEEESEVAWVNIKRKKKARKRTRMNMKLSHGSEELHFQGILKECIPGEKGMLEELSPNISKYWCQRYLLFSRYDHGIKMDEEGWFSATPEPIAKHHAFRCGDGVVVDCFTGVGGNAIHFAQRSKHVIAIDIDPRKIEYAQQNAAIYGVNDHIDFVIGDSFLLAPRLKADTVFLSPPWGGPSYLKATTYDINTMLKPHGGNYLFNAVKGIASKVVMFLPRTVDLNQLAELSLSVDPPWSLEVERNFLNGKLKAITAYFTDISL